MRKTLRKPYKYRRISEHHTFGRRKFRGYIITKSALFTAACIISAVIFLFTAWIFFINTGAEKTENILKAGMAEAMPFLSFNTKNSFDVKNMFSKILPINNPQKIVASSSPVFDIKENSEKKKAITEKKSTIVTNRVSEQNSPSVKLEIKNETDFDVNINQLLKTDIKFNVSENEPLVLIVHTHASESYTPSKAYDYKLTSNYRTQDLRYNMIRVGEEVAKYLKKEGINTIHDKTVNDYPSYNDSYNKTEKVIKANLQKYPSLRIVLDIHRDAVGDEQSGVKFTSTINGEKVAQVMIVCGTDQNLENPEWRKNLAFALKIQKHFEEKYPLFLRPLNLRKERFNMHLTNGSLLFEIGTNHNTLDESLAAARTLGTELAKIIKELY